MLCLKMYIQGFHITHILTHQLFVGLCLETPICHDEPLPSQSNPQCDHAPIECVPLCIVYRSCKRSARYHLLLAPRAPPRCHTVWLIYGIGRGYVAMWRVHGALGYNPRSNDKGIDILDPMWPSIELLLIPGFCGASSWEQSSHWTGRQLSPSQVTNPQHKLVPFYL